MRSCRSTERSFWGRERRLAARSSVGDGISVLYKVVAKESCARFVPLRSYLAILPTRWAVEPLWSISCMTRVCIASRVIVSPLLAGPCLVAFVPPPIRPRPWNSFAAIGLSASFGWSLLAAVLLLTCPPLVTTSALYNTESACAIVTFSASHALLKFSHESATSLLAIVASRHVRTSSLTAIKKPAMQAVKPASITVRKPPKSTFTLICCASGFGWGGAGATTVAASWNTGDGLLSTDDTDVQLATLLDAETLRGARDPARCRRARGRRDATFRAGTSSRGVETARNIRDAVRGSDGLCAGCRLGCRFLSLVRFWLP